MAKKGWKYPCSCDTLMQSGEALGMPPGGRKSAFFSGLRRLFCARRYICGYTAFKRYNKNLSGKEKIQ